MNVNPKFSVLQVLDELTHNADASGRVSLSTTVLDQVMTALERAGQIEAAATQLVAAKTTGMELTVDHPAVRLLMRELGIADIRPPHESAQ